MTVDEQAQADVESMPERMDFLTAIQSMQVVHDDKQQWILDAMNSAIETQVRKALRYKRESAITLTLKLKPEDLNQITLKASLDVKEPKPKELPFTAYTNSRGLLLVEDPEQMRLPINKSVSLKRKA